MAKMPVRTRRLKAADDESILNLYNAIFDQAQHPVGPKWSQDQLRDECVDRMGLVLEVKSKEEVGQVNERWQIAAFILFRDQISALEITFLGSDPNLVKRGFMRQLILEMQTLTPVIWLEVHEKNLPARALYVSLGFLEVGTRPRYYPDGAAAIVYNYG